MSVLIQTSPLSLRLSRACQDGTREVPSGFGRRQAQLSAYSQAIRSSSGLDYKCLAECSNASGSPASKDQTIALTSRGYFTIGGVGPGSLGADYSTAPTTVVQVGRTDTGIKPEHHSLLTRLERESKANFDELDDASPTGVGPTDTQSPQPRLPQETVPRTPQSPIQPTLKPPHTPPRLPPHLQQLQPQPPNNTDTTESTNPQHSPRIARRALTAKITQLSLTQHGGGRTPMMYRCPSCGTQTQ